MSSNIKRNLFEERVLERTSLGDLGGPKWSTPKRDDENKPPAFDQISMIDPFGSMLIGSEKNFGRKDVIKVARNRLVVYFGFVAIGETRVITYKPLNQSDEQYRFKCTLESKSEYFKIESSEVLIIQPNEEGSLMISYKPTNLDQNSCLLTLEKLNGIYKKFTIRILGYGGCAKISMADHYFQTGLAQKSPSGAIIYKPDFFPPPPSIVNSTCYLELINTGDRNAFVCIRAVTKRGEVLPESAVIIRPSRCVIEKGNKIQKLQIRVKPLLRKSGRESNASSMSNSSMERGCSVILQIIWGEETQRLRFKLWQSKRLEKFLIMGEDFTQRFENEDRSMKICNRIEPFDHECDEFKNSMRIFDINIVDNRLSALFNLN